MNNEKLYEVAEALVVPGKGILAADQSARTMNKQLEAIGAPADAETRRQYRQLLMTTEGIEEYVTGVILYDGTIRNKVDDGTPFADLLISKGIIPIIKVDKSTVPHPNFPGEVVTQGLDDLPDRMAEYYDMGARAAKWRAVITIGDGIPTEENIRVDAVSLARYAAICQEAGIVPMVEPEVLHAGSHDLSTAEEVTTKVLQAVFRELEAQRVDLKGVILKSSMVLAGSEFETQSTPEEVAEASLNTYKNSVPHDVPGIVFLSGGQTPERVTANLNAIAKLEKEAGNLPWELAFSFSRGLEKPAQQVWSGKPDNVLKAQEALLERLRLNCLADKGEYVGEPQ